MCSFTFRRWLLGIVCALVTFIEWHLRYNAIALHPPIFRPAFNVWHIVCRFTFSFCTFSREKRHNDTFCAARRRQVGSYQVDATKSSLPQNPYHQVDARKSTCYRSGTVLTFKLRFFNFLVICRNVLEWHIGQFSASGQRRRIANGSTLCNYVVNGTDIAGREAKKV